MYYKKIEIELNRLSCKDQTVLISDHNLDSIEDAIKTLEEELKALREIINEPINPVIGRNLVIQKNRILSVLELLTTEE